ncbi:MAG: pilus assembly protein TadG-related protein [Pseudomonadota bacterium]
MFWGKRKDPPGRARGFMASLARDVRANTLVIMAMALVPLAGMVGGGIDISRMYILKTRLQHACDAGALAGRKAMGGGTWAYNNNYSRAQAEMFFDGNFQTGSFDSSALSRVFTENAGKVTGTVSAVLPMTLMRIFGRTTETIEVTCSTEMRLPNTDVMFVLDTTGSMADPQPGDTVSKIDALKTSVKCFYEIVARLDTDATCTTGAPSGGTGDQVQLRFGFVPYAVNVNVGKLLPTEWFVDSAQYQTREAQFSNGTTSSTPAVTSSSMVNRDPRAWATYSFTYTSSSGCTTPIPPTSGFTAIGSEGAPVEQSSTGGNPNTVTWATYQYGSITEYQRVYSSSTFQCQMQRRTVYGDLRRVYSRTDTTTQVFSQWRYAQLPVNVGLLKNGTAWRNDFQWPVGASGTNKTITWDGCVEERDTVRATNYDPIPSGASDLDIDTVPSSDATRWKPVLRDLLYTRGDQYYGYNYPQWSYNPVVTSTDYAVASQYFCPTEARKLQSWPMPSAFSSYVDSLQPSGNTYHDIGLIWGARLLSPTGLFKAENALTAQGGEIERHLIFMTDGDACAQPYDYTAYGVPWFDRRQTSTSSAPTGGCTFNTATLVEQVNKRTEGLCSAIKNKNITLWVIAFGNLATETETRLSNCATSGRYFKATSAAQLQSTFKSIADQISMLRLTK